MLIKAPPSIPVPVRAIYLSVNRQVAVANGMDPIISLWQNRSWRGRCTPTPSPHQALQLAKLMPKAGVDRGQGLGDGGVVAGYAGLRGSAQVSVT